MILPQVLEAYSYSGPPKEFSEEFYQTYGCVQSTLGTILNLQGRGTVIVASGEAMLALWGALKSVCTSESRVLCVSNGIYGLGFQEMAQSIGVSAAEVIGTQYTDFTEAFFGEVERRMGEFRPTVVTMCHCETPSGSLNPLEEIGRLVAKRDDCLLLVDCVSSAFGVPIDMAKMGIDVCLIGSQKVLGLLPDLSIVGVTDKAWTAIERVNYKGYDALRPWRDAPHHHPFPYTHNSRAINALAIALRLFEQEGLEAVYARHAHVAQYCRQRVTELGLSLFPKESNHRSPTVTCICVPEGWEWNDLNYALRQRGVQFSGNMADLKNKVFRIGHMGTQCDKQKVKEALDILEEILNSRK